ncbi:hypothetical protein E2C01_006055 [Portunus trituberculatus]|uniref:Uncharacterized protein n=1 Tax=Portunus trituberculatus TaxID=210409 RepID=A0A5B7CX50_PORTR|nr:hypothetical protein [Portunus trituberculatus]
MAGQTCDETPFKVRHRGTPEMKVVILLSKPPLNLRGSLNFHDNLSAEEDRPRLHTSIMALLNLDLCLSISEVENEETNRKILLYDTEDTREKRKVYEM